MQARLPIHPSTRYPFDLARVLDGSQDFRWRKLEQGWYSGVLDRNIVHVRQDHDDLEYRAHTDLDSLLISYFRLHEDIDAIYATLSSRDPDMAALARDHPYLRVLRQPDPWECTVAYICSANNNVKGIGRILEDIAEEMGKPVQLGQDIRYTFPSPEQVLEAGPTPLRTMRLGLERHSHILHAARQVWRGELDLSRLSLSETPYPEARQRLMQLRGVGPKIADCIALFSLDKPEAFPIDTHIRKALISRYFPPGARLSDKQLGEFARVRYGKYAGWAGQLLFQSRWSAAS
ncbi:MAG: DNA glycosylase [Chloroflexota bacterium]|nr:DNA glycosylase [Chloroflexota bacterium]MDE2883633.1 DNA glycosylase [Chloroflexota bacterium]